ncbi:uncharacterized protein LOC131325756 isoform X3 [Rhododendron vialii]|uniref:uncharacterized protein LOC131325756 isoform X3 n=1 Tax=Rhododendron vialii TaxID=182163 RepID=UPI00265E4725|nr:uncharacterized protein LOC131325756 isoform X3 [Rhododendron vialii]
MEKNPFVQAGAIDGGMDQLKDSCPFIPLCHILKATNDFDDALVIGVGGFGKVYEANIGSGATTTVVAIKRLRAKSKQGAEEFWKELKLLSKLRHTNLVSLIGYCNENQEMILVYEYIARGTLANHLYKTSRSHLTWEQRLNICLHAARGLDYLHNGTLQGIIHGDVKSTNILLDDHSVAKVSDLGLSKSTTTHTATHVRTVAKGTFGYLDPEYFLTRRLTKKSDVYAFGVVLLEVLCGRPAIDLSVLDEERILSHWAQMNIKEGTLDRIIDPSLNGDTTPDSLEYFAELANKCLHIQSKERPTMTEVVKSLQIALVSHERQGRSQGTIAKAWTLGGLLSRHRNPLLVPPNEIQKSSIPANGVGKPAKRTTTAFLATNSKAFDDFKARSTETFMIHQENIVKKEEGFINEHLPDHVFANSKKNEDNDETVNKVYNRKGSGNSMELKHWEFKKLEMDPGNKNNRAYQSGVLLSNSKRKKKIEALKRLGGSLIPTLVLEDYNNPLSFQALSGLSNIFHGLLSGCGDGHIIVLNTNHNHIDRADIALHRPSSPQPKALPDGGDIVLLDSSEQKPSVGFDATNNRAYQSDVLVSNSEEKNTGEASRRQCMPEGVLSLVDSMTNISLTYFDAPENSARFVREYQSGHIVFNSEKKDMGEGLNRECLTKSALNLDDSSKQKSLLDVAVTGKKLHIVRAYESGPVVSFSNDKNEGEALKRECITKSILGLEDLQQHCGGRGDDVAKSFCGIHTADSLARISFEVLETLPTREQPNDCVPLLSLGRLTLEDCVQQEKSPDLPRVTQINGVEQRVTKLPRYFGGLTAQSASSSRWPIGLPDGGYIVLLDPLDQSTKHIEHVARADQCSPTLSLAEKKMVRKTLKRKCRTMSAIFEDNHQHFARRCEGAAKSLGVTHIFRKHGINQVYTVKRIKQHGIHQWPFFRQKWAIRKGYSLGEERPFEVSRLSMDEKLDSRLQLIHMSQFARSSPWALALPDGGEIFRPTALSRSNEFAATNNISHLVGQDQSGSTASHYECKNTREKSDKQGLEDLEQHFGCKHKDAVKSLGVSGSMFKSTCRQHWVSWWPGRFENNDSLAWKSFKVLDGLPLGEQSNSIRHLARRRTLTHKHCVRLKKSQDLQRFMLRDCLGGLFPQSDIGLPDGGHVLSLSKKKNVRKTLKRKCRTMSVLSLEDHQQHVSRRWEDAVKCLGAKRICRLLTIHRETTANCIRRQLGTRRRPFKQSAIGLPDGGHILSLSKKKIVRKTLKRKCRRMSVLSLEDHKQHVDRRWEGAAKSHGAKRICRQLVIHRSSTAKHIRKEHGIHPWPFQRSFISLPDGGHILPLSEKKILRKTLKRKCRGMSVLSLVDRQQLVDRRWEDAAKNIGAKLICGQLVIHRVSIAKRIYRRHGIYHRWPFQQDWATMKGYSLGDERPVQVISLSTLAKLVSRLQLIYISWLGRFSPRSSALPGREIVEPIALSSSEFAATKNIAQHVRQDQSGSVASDSRNERTREQEDPEEIYTSITSDGLRRLKGRMNREDAAASFGVSVSTFKRKCRDYGIDRWPHVRKKKVGRPPDQHGEGNTSTARKTPSHNVQNGMEGELGGQNQEANVLQRDFMGGLIALNTESGLITVGRPPDQHGEKNTSTACEEPSNNVETRMEIEPVGQNQEANVFQRDFTEGLIALSTENGLITVGRPPDQHGEGNTSTARETPSHNVQNGMELVGQNQEANVLRGGFMGGQIALNTESGLITVGRPPDQHGEKNTSTACEEPSNDVETRMEIEPVGQNQEANVFQRDFTEGLIALSTENGVVTGSSFERASQVNDQSTWSTPYPNHDALVLHQPQITSMLSENRGGSIDWRNSLASQAEPFSDRHISGSSNLAFPTWSDQAAPSQHAEGQSVQSTVYPDHYAVHRFPQGHVFESINWNEHTNSLALQAEPFSDKQISGSMWRHPDQLEVQTKQFTAHPNPNALGLPQFQIASTQVPSANEDRRNSLTSQDEAFFMGRVSESSNLAFPTYSDAAAPSQPVATILIERQDTRSMKVKATYGDSIIKFQLPLTSGIKELMQEVSKTLDWELGSFNVDYKDEDGDWILMARDDNVSEYLQLLTSLGNQATKLKVRDKVPNTTNICETCGSLKQQRP